jgi:hypothetical protein
MIASTSGNGRIVKRVIANDISYSFSIVKNQRINGIPNHKTLAIIGTVRKSQFTAERAEFWKLADAALSGLVSAGKLWVNDEIKVRKQFEAVIPRASAVIKTVATKPNYETLQKLKSRGYDL